jgi:hypothetical protein
MDDFEEWNRETTTFATHCIAGSMSGLMEHVAMYPVDTVKVSTFPFAQLVISISSPSIDLIDFPHYVCCLDPHASSLLQVQLSEYSASCNGVGR